MFLLALRFSRLASTFLDSQNSAFHTTESRFCFACHVRKFQHRRPYGFTGDTPLRSAFKAYLTYRLFALRYLRSLAFDKKRSVVYAARY
jgi:hypothetical protein